MKRVLVTGAAGIIGKKVCEQLHAQGYEVAGMDMRAWEVPVPGVSYHTVDIRKRAGEDVFRKFAPEVIVHMATVTHLTSKGDARFRINLGGTKSAIDFASQYGAKHFVFVGRHTYYGAAADSPLYHSEEEPPIGATSFPELADLVAADLYAGSNLWRHPDVDTAVLRFCYTLGPKGHGTLASFVKGKLVPMILGFDPLFQFMHEDDVASAVVSAVQHKLRGVFNVAGPHPVPLSSLVRTLERRAIPVPELLISTLLGRIGLPILPRGAIAHIKYPIVIDAAKFHAATGFVHRYDEYETMVAFKKAFPV